METKRAGYHRLPRTIIVTILATLIVIAGSRMTMHIMERRVEYLRLTTRFSELSSQYTERSQADLDASQLAAEDAPNIAAMAQGSDQADSLLTMAEAKARDAVRLKDQSRKWAAAAKYYDSFRRKYQEAAKHPWQIVETPDGDPLDVAGEFLKAH